MILGLFVALALSSPLAPNDGCDDGQIVCWFDHGRRCTCESAVLRLGTWDPRPAPEEWPSNAYQSPPADFGAYATERREP